MAKSDRIKKYKRRINNTVSYLTFIHRAHPEWNQWFINKIFYYLDRIQALQKEYRVWYEKTFGGIG